MEKSDDNCRCCERKEKRIHHLEKQLAKFKKQVVRTRQRLSELEYLAKEVDFIAARTELEDIQIEEEDDESLDKPEEYDNLEEEDEWVEITRFDVPSGKMVTETRKKRNFTNAKFKESDKLSYSRTKRLK